MKFDRILILLFFLFSVLHQMIGVKEDLTFLRLAQLIGLVAFFTLFMEVKLKDVIGKTSFKILLICLISTILVGIANNRLYLLNLIYPLSFFSISWLVIKTKPSPRFFIIVTLLVFAFLSFSFVRGVPPAEWLKGSRNYVSVVLIYLTITTICIARINSKVPTLLVYFVLPLLCVAFSVIALGRSGIISSLMLFFASIFYLIKDKKNKSKIRAFLVVISLGMIYLVSEKYDAIEANYLYKFQTKALELDERGDVINLYTDKIDFLSSIFSVPDINFIAALEGITLHNSYLHWHFSYGLGAFLIFILILQSIFKSIKQEVYLNLLLVIILVRSFSDQILLSDGILLGLPLLMIIAINDHKVFVPNKPEKP